MSRVADRTVSVAVEGGEIEVFIVEPVAETRLTLLCLHGWTLNAAAFGAQRPLAEMGVAIATFNRRGFGSSRLLPNFATELTDLSAIIASIDTPIVLYGVSQGARLALRHVVSDGSPVVGLIVQGGHIDGLQVEEAPGEGIPFESYRKWLLEGDLDRFRKHWLQHPLVFRGCEDVVPSQLADLISRYRGTDLLTEGALPTPLDIRTQLAALTLPRLVRSGSKEVASRRRHAAALTAMQNTQAAVIEGGGHLCNISHGGAVNSAISAWLLSVFD